MSRHYRNVLQPHSILDGLTCDGCKRFYSKIKQPQEMQEFMTWENHCGYGSTFGDLNMVTLDLCQHCVKTLLGPYIRITPLGGMIPVDE